MIGWFDKKKIWQLLNIPEKGIIGLVITPGYPQDDYELCKKICKNPDEICRFNTY